MTAPEPAARARELKRIFLAIFPPAEVQRAVVAAAEALKRPGDGVSWVKRENLHYTLRFMGNRVNVRERSAQTALDLLRRRVLALPLDARLTS